ncbi:MAG: hypothetical protein IKO72_09335 [Kiritimatiellae bacterium]|nr:hypothetical protein [Kiritimatiellia bacterium]
MVRKTLILPLALAVAAVCAGTVPVMEPWTVSSSVEEHVSRYSPPILSNGDIGMLVDFRNCQYQDTPSLKSIHAVGAGYFPATCRQGRRTPDAKLVTLGRVEEEVVVGGGKDAKPTSWSQRLDIFGAASVCSNGYANGSCIGSTAFVASGKPVFAVRKSFSGEVERYVFKWVFRRPGPSGRPPAGVAFAVEPGRIRWSTDFDGLRAEAAADGEPPLVGTVELRCSCPSVRLSADGDTLYATVERPEGNVDFFVVFNDSMDDAPCSGDAVAAAGWDTLKARHEAEWAEFWKRSEVQIPDASVLRTYQTAFYNLKCWSTKWAVPIGILPTHWNGKYFGFGFNGAAFAVAGHFDEAKRIGRFWAGILPQARHRAGGQKRKEGLSNPAAGARFAWQPVEDGHETTGDGRWKDHFMHMGTIPADCWNAWLYTGDRKFLASTYPVIRDCANYFRTWLVQRLDDGRTVIGPVCDLERLPCPARNAFLTTCSAIYALERAADAATVLGVDAASVPAWCDTAAALRRDLPKAGGRYLAFEGCDRTSVGTLSGLFPYNVLPRDDAVQKATVDHFDRNGIRVGNMYSVGTRICTWYAAWLADDYARLLDGEAAFRNLSLANVSAGFFNEIFEINEPSYRSCPWCQAPPATFVQTVHDMLLQCEGDVLRVAPAVPSAWRDFSFRLRAYDDVEVSARFADGRPVSLMLRAGASHSGRTKKVKFADGRTFDARITGEGRDFIR